MAESGLKKSNITPLFTKKSKQDNGNGGNYMNNDDKYVSQKEFYEMRLANEVAHARQEEKASSMDWKLNWILGLMTSTILVALISWTLKILFSFI